LNDDFPLPRWQQNLILALPTIWVRCGGVAFGRAGPEVKTCTWLKNHQKVPLISKGVSVVSHEPLVSRVKVTLGIVKDDG